MVEAVMLWNEPNNLSHWDFKIDPDWKIFADMVITASKAIRRENPDLPIALGGISPIDPNFIRYLGSHGVLDAVDIISVHGFPLDWNHWNINEWPAKIDEIRAVTNLPIWVSEAGASSFGALYGVASCVIQLGMALGPGFYGLLYDAFGGYRVPLLLAAAADLVAAAVVSIGAAKAAGQSRAGSQSRR